MCVLEKLDIPKLMRSEYLILAVRFYIHTTLDPDPGTKQLITYTACQRMLICLSETSYSSLENRAEYERSGKPR